MHSSKVERSYKGFLAGKIESILSATMVCDDRTFKGVSQVQRIRCATD